MQSSAAAAEKSFSLLSTGFGDLKDNSLSDYIEVCIMLRLNHKK